MSEKPHTPPLAVLEPGAEPLDADRLAPGEIAALKEREREGRERGAATFLARVAASRGAWRLRAEDETLLRWLAPRPGMVALDAGSGVGRQALRVAPRVRRLVCVDFSAAALAELEREAGRRGIANLETRAADLGDLPPLLGPFDLAYSSEVLQHVPSAAGRLRVLRNLRAVLAPGGRCVVNVARWRGHARGPQDGFWGGGVYRHYFTPPELRALLESAGFTAVRLHPLLVLPGRLARRLPLGWTAIERWCSGLPGLAGLGRFLIGVGRVPAA